MDTVHSLDAFASLTDEEQTRLRRLNQGARFTGSARNQLAEFAQQRGWSDEVLNDVLALLARTGA